MTTDAALAILDAGKPESPATSRHLPDVIKHAQTEYLTQRAQAHLTLLNDPAAIRQHALDRLGPKDFEGGYLSGNALIKIASGPPFFLESDTQSAVEERDSDGLAIRASATARVSWLTGEGCTETGYFDRAEADHLTDQTGRVHQKKRAGLEAVIRGRAETRARARAIERLLQINAPKITLDELRAHQRSPTPAAQPQTTASATAKLEAAARDAVLLLVAGNQQAADLALAKIQARTANRLEHNTAYALCVVGAALRDTQPPTAP